MQSETHRSFGPVKKEHIFLIQKWRNGQMDVLRQRRKIKRDEQIKWFNRLKKDHKQKLFSVFEGKGFKKKLIGYCGLTNIDCFNHRAEISFLVDTKRTLLHSVYKADMVSALSYLASYAFLKLHLKKIFVETYEFRKEHIKVIEQFGFRRDGVLRLHICLKGKYYNSVIHSMLREEYLKKGNLIGK